MRLFVFKSKYHPDIHIYEQDQIGLIACVLNELSQMDPEEAIAIECYEVDFGEE